jgi:hypothetical protein
MIQPALNNFYPKIAGKDQSLMKIWVNNDVRSDLQWAMNHLRNSLGVKLLSSVSWNVDDADEVVFCDACLQGMAFWFPNHRRGFYSPVPPSLLGKTIFFYEAVAATSAIDNLRERRRDLKIILHTDSLNTVDIFNSLRCLSTFNPLLLFCVDTCISNKFDLRVLHVPGVENEVADAISRRNFEKALKLVPDLQISFFQPPHCATLGAAKK